MKTFRLHFMGIGGQGISAVAQMARLAGNTVTGCDRQASATTRALEQVGIPIQIGHAAEHLQESDTLVISPAVPALDANNMELVAAKEQGKRVIPWQALLGEIMQGKCVLSVSGVHGKGTTTALLSLALVDAGLDPTCVIGAVVPRFGANYRLGQSQYVVNEADEFNHNFWHYHPRLVIVTSIEYEHPEFFADYEAYLAAFEHFIRGMDMHSDWPLPPTLILNADSPGCFDLWQRLADWHGQVITYSVVRPHVGLQTEVTNTARLASTKQKSMHFEAYDVKLDGETSFRIRTQRGVSGHDVPSVVQLQLPGLHNIQNSLAAFAAASILGIDASSLVKTLEGFGGTRRRFEIRYEGPLAVDGRRIEHVTLVDDYAHHPTAIEVTLDAVHRRYPGRRIVAVYQPHMYSRTQAFFEQFLQAFDTADIAIIVDIFPARERDTGLVHARDLVAALAQRPHFSQAAQVMHGGSVQDTVAMLRKTLCSGDIVLIMGAGDIYTVTEQLMQDAL